MEFLTCLFMKQPMLFLFLATFNLLCHSDVNHFKDANGSTLQFDSTRGRTVQGKKLLICCFSA